jgi:hypothetical protein
MIHLGKDIARQFNGYHVPKPWACARIATTTMTLHVIVAKAMCFLEGAP